MPPAKKRQQKKPVGVTVAVTGPTGDIGKSVLRALDRSRDVKKVVGMVRRPFDPASLGLKKTEYVQGDVTKREDVDALVKGADVVVHLAFIILSAGSDESREINLRGSRNVFEAAVEAKAKRLVYASSVAAYGFHADNPQPLTEDVPTRGTEAHPYSAMKAEVEELLHEVLDDTATDPYVFRPCIVAGPDALTLVDQIPYVRLGEKLPRVLRELFDSVPALSGPAGHFPSSQPSCPNEALRIRSRPGKAAVPHCRPGYARDRAVVPRCGGRAEGAHVPARHWVHLQGLLRQGEPHLGQELPRARHGRGVEDP